MMIGGSKIEVLQATFLNTYAVRVCKKLSQITNSRCCGCKISKEKQDCLMLSQDEKVETYFDEALGYVDLNVVESNMQACTDSLIPEKKNQRMFICQHLRDPRMDDEWKAKLKSSVRDIMNFSF